MKILFGTCGLLLSKQKTNRRLNLAKSNVFVKSVLASAMLVAFSTSSFAKDENLEKISAMKNTDTAIDIPVVPQTGKNVDQLKANLKKIKMPEGF